MTLSLLTDISFFLITFYISLFSSLILVPVAGRLAKALGVLDAPDCRKVHRNPIPRMGGLGIAGAFVIGVLLCVKTPPLVQGVLVGAAVITFTGLLDDIVAIPPQLKFAGEILAVAIFMMTSGVSLPGFGDLLGMGEIRFASFSGLITVFCMVGVINALNLSDGLDGLAGGLSGIALFFIAVLAYGQKAWFFLVLALAGLGAVLGFLRYNTHPAKLFMGDCGSLLLGFLLAALSVGLAHGAGLYQPVAPVVLACILALPVLDTIYVMGGRLRRGENPFLPDQTHLHHRLLRLGLPHRHVVTIIYGVASLFGVLGVVGRAWPQPVVFAAGSALAAIVYGGVTQLERKVGRARAARGARLRTRRPANGLLLRLAGRSAPYLLVLFLALLLVPLVCLIPAPRIIGYCALAACLVALLLYPWKGGRQEMPMAHGVFSLLILAVLLILMFTPGRPAWYPWYFAVTGGVAMCWTVPKIFFTREGVYAVPSSFELMLLLLVWFVPMVLAPELGISDGARITMLQSGALAVPFLLLFKVAARRHARRNRAVALSFVVAFAVLGVTSFWLR